MKRLKPALWILPSLAAVVAIWFASRHSSVPKKPESADTETTVDYKLKGVVNKVDRNGGKVAISHEEIPGFMDAMLMTFPVKSKSLIDDLMPGDEVEGTLTVARRDGKVIDYSITALDVMVPAPVPKASLKLRVGGGSPRLEPGKKVLSVGESVPDFAMTTQEGKTLRLADLRGKVVVLTFIYTRCPLPDYCPLVDKKFHDLADKVEARRATREGVRLLSVSFDPEHDTAEALAAHARGLGAKPPLWTFAVAAHDELRKVAEPLGLVYGPMENQIVHNLSIAVIDQEGRLARLDAGAAGKAWKPGNTVKLIAELMSAHRK